MQNIQSRAMLVSLTQRAWKAQAADRMIATETEEKYETDTGVLSVVKSLVPRHYIKPIKQIMALGYAEHVNLTFPGLVRGQHLLASTMFDRYVQTQRQIMDAFQERVNRFVEIYPDIVKAAPARLSGAFKPDDFPSVKQIRNYFEYKITSMPVPELKDWRIEGVSDQDMSVFRNEAEDEVRAMYNKATRELFERAREVLSRVANQAKEYKGGPGTAQLRDATIGHLKEIAGLVVSMNISNDEELARVGYEMIENFADAEGKALRASEDARKRLIAAAEKIMARIPK